VAVGAGAGGLVSAKQSARRGARSALIEQHLAGGAGNIWQRGWCMMVLGGLKVSNFNRIKSTVKT